MKHLMEDTEFSAQLLPPLCALTWWNCSILMLLIQLNHHVKTALCCVQGNGSLKNQDKRMPVLSPITFPMYFWNLAPVSLWLCCLRACGCHDILHAHTSSPKNLGRIQEHTAKKRDSNMFPHTLLFLGFKEVHNVVKKPYALEILLWPLLNLDGASEAHLSYWTASWQSCLAIPQWVQRGVDSVIDSQYAYLSWALKRQETIS